MELAKNRMNSYLWLLITKVNSESVLIVLLDMGLTTFFVMGFYALTKLGFLQHSGSACQVKSVEPLGYFGGHLYPPGILVNGLLGFSLAVAGASKRFPLLFLLSHVAYSPLGFGFSFSGGSTRISSGGEH
jgi:hypothetical protein